MVAGHYAVALAAKRWAPRTSLGTLVAAGAFLDLLWPVLVLAGIEAVTIEPGATAANPLVFVSYPWSHSLSMSAAWGILLGAIYFALTGYGAGAVALALLVPSHWLLDAIVHVPDLPLVPWSEFKVGLGLWNSLGLSLAVELGLFAAGAWIYFRATHPRDPKGVTGAAALIVLMLLVYAGATFGPPPPSVSAVAWTDLGQFGIVALAWWADKHRSSRR